MPKMKKLFTGNEKMIWIEDVYASALNMCSIAEEMYLAKSFADVAYYEPFYLKDFVAGKKARG